MVTVTSTVPFAQSAPLMALNLQRFTVMRHQAMMDEPCPHRAIGVSSLPDLLHSPYRRGKHFPPIGFPFFPDESERKSRYSQFAG